MSMSDPKVLSESVIILDGEVLRSDCDGVPRFYLVRIYEDETRKGYAGVRVRLELEGDPTAYAHEYCRDHPDDIREACEYCISTIEDLMQSEWDREDAASQLRAE
jgi:hypothetical protein